jgi:DNA-binding MarR family transcriptional regulator
MEHIEPPAEIVAVADSFMVLTRTSSRIRTQFLAAAGDDVDRAAHVLISTLATYGPMRAGALAEAVGSDPSTVSRQIAGLVRDGFVERQADQQDGRVSVLRATAAGEEIYREQRRLRYQHYARILSGWSAADAVLLAELMDRFAADLERGRQDWFGPDPARSAETAGAAR